MNDLSLFFGNNEIILDKVMTAASKTSEQSPFLPTYLSQEDRWHIMNVCMNRVSAIFGTFHVFFNEARRCKSYFRSAWYLFSISCFQNKHHGRFFVTPYKPVLSRVDVGVKRIRIDLVNEQEMREICSATITPPDWGFFNNRHRQRWLLLEKMSELFENQLVIINDDTDPIHPSSPGVITRVTSMQEDDSDDDSDGRGSDCNSPSSSWATMSNHHICEQPDLNRHGSNPRELALRALRSARRHRAECKNSDNCIMRVHIPYPSSVIDNTTICETHAKDVVLFE